MKYCGSFIKPVTQREIYREVQKLWTVELVLNQSWAGFEEDHGSFK